MPPTLPPRPPTPESYTTKLTVDTSGGLGIPSVDLGARRLVAIPEIERPEYHSPDMDLSIEIDRGDEGLPHACSLVVGPLEAAAEHQQRHADERRTAPSSVRNSSTPRRTRERRMPSSRATLRT